MAAVCLKNFHPGPMSKNGLSFPAGIDEGQKHKFQVEQE